jgi:hypothetical protein
MKLFSCDSKFTVKILCKVCLNFIERNAFNSFNDHKDCLELGAKSHPKEEKIIWSCGFCTKLYETRSFVSHIKTEHKPIFKLLMEGENETM